MAVSSANHTQEVRCFRLIIDFKWSGLNNTTSWESSAEAMQFGVTLFHIIMWVLTEDPMLGPVYLSKFDLDDIYIHLWFWVDDTLSTTLLLHKKTPMDEQLVSFHLSLLMVFMESTPYF